MALEIGQSQEVQLYGTTVPVATYNALSSQAKFALVSAVQKRTENPLILQVATKYTASEANYPQGSTTPWLYPGISNADTSPTDSFGCIVLTYGLKGVRRRVSFDLRCATYQLPPCDQVTVETWAYTTEASFSKNLKVRAMLSEGNINNAELPTFTFQKSLAAAATTAITPPAQARYFDFWVTSSTGVFTATQDTTRLYAKRDAATPNVYPPWTPLEIGAGDAINLANGAAGVEVVQGRFFLTL